MSSFFPKRLAELPARFDNASQTWMDLARATRVSTLTAIYRFVGLVKFSRTDRENKLQIYLWGSFAVHDWNLLHFLTYFFTWRIHWLKLIHHRRCLLKSAALVSKSFKNCSILYILGLICWWLEVRCKAILWIYGRFFSDRKLFGT